MDANNEMFLKSEISYRFESIEDVADFLSWYKDLEKGYDDIKRISRKIINDGRGVLCTRGHLVFESSNKNAILYKKNNYIVDLI